MNYYALFPTISSFVLICLGIYIYIKNSKEELNKIFFMFTFFLFIWIFFFSLIYWATGNKELAYTFSKIGFLGVVFFPTTILHFVLIFTNNNGIKYIKYFYFISFILFVIGFFTNLFYSGILLHYWGYYPVAGKLYWIVILQVITVVPISIYLLYKSMKDNLTDPIKKEQIKYLILGFSLIFFGISDYLAKYPSIVVYPSGYIIVLLFAIDMAVCMLKTNLMNVRFVITQTSILIALYLFILGLPFIIGIKTGKWFIASILLFILSSSGPAIFKFLQRKTEKILFSEQEQYQQFLLQASKGMVEQHELDKLCKLIVRMLTKTVKIKFAILFVYDEEKHMYYCVSSRGQNLKQIDITFDINSTIINFIKSKAKPFVLFNASQETKKLFDEINSEISLVIPAIVRKDLVAFVLMGNKLNNSIYSKRDLDIFKTLSNQVALSITNCSFLNKTNKQQKKLFEAEKLASIGGMADGIAHQIKNRLNQFYLVGEEINFELNTFKNNHDDFIRKQEDVKHMVSYVCEMADSIVDNVKKTNSILQGILNFAKSNDRDRFFSNFSLRNLIEQSLELIKIKHQKDNIPIVLNLPEEDEIYGVKSQIQEAIFNCIDNAYEAILEKKFCIQNKMVKKLNDFVDEIENYKPEIIIELKYIDDFAKIYIQDNGIGIKTENNSKVFSAFFTTKVSSRSGSGIGTYVVKRMIVENHNGKIEFKSKYGYGTTFVITLPMKKNSKER